MTEYERVAKKYNWPLELKAEEKCGFIVSEKLRKVQMIELDLLIEFDQLCKKHSLKYFVIFGTLLGAIRHNGFIPWDDDIDVAMPREDYNKLLALNKKEFQFPYFLQVPGKDIGYWFSFAKFRNSKTTAISLPFRNEKFNQGILLDIVPIDNCCIEDMEENWFKIRNLALENSANMRRSLKYPSQSDLERFKKYPPSNPKDIYDAIEKIAQRHNKEQTEWVGILVATVNPIKKQVFRREFFEEVISCSFEGVSIKVPRNYDKVLKVMYGDYMSLPPKEQRGIWHSTMTFDPDIPYYLWQKKNKEELSLYDIK